MKKQSRKVTKRCLAFLMVLFLISINSFAAVVSDNDGSAFITKAEFDAIKAEFQGQIDSYNRSIDSKIDGAVAAYLAGIRMDDRKIYAVYGADVGDWGSPARAAKKFSVFEIGNGTWGTVRADEGVFGADLPNTKNRLLLYSDVKSNIGGYGEGWWMYGIYYSGSRTLGSETSGFIASTYMNFKPWNPTKGNFGSFYFSLGESASNKVVGEIAGSLINEIYNKQLSDAFEYPIPIMNPKFPLYEIIEGSGNFRVYCGCDKQDGTGNKAEFWNVSNSSWGLYGMTPGVLLRVQHKNGTMEPAKIDLTTAEEDRWLVGDFNVEKGDKIILDITGYPDGGSSGAKSSFWFTKEVSGWDLQTT